jgi:filamentous hemagglutinin family protein
MKKDLKMSEPIFHKSQNNIISLTEDSLRQMIETTASQLIATATSEAIQKAKKEMSEEFQKSVSTLQNRVQELEKENSQLRGLIKVQGQAQNVNVCNNIGVDKDGCSGQKILGSITIACGGIVGVAESVLLGLSTAGLIVAKGAAAKTIAGTFVASSIAAAPWVLPIAAIVTIAGIILVYKS